MAKPAPDLLLAGSERARRSLPLDTLGSAIGATLAVHLLVASAVVTDRRSAPNLPASQPATTSPSPSPSPLPQISSAEEQARLRTAQNVARFAAGLICTETAGFTYSVAEHNRDVSIATVAAGLPGRAPALRLKVSRLPRGTGISYSVQESSEPCLG
ncbi:MAG TPA: hypothetical protein VNB94_03910 [Mycobacteriales bacterium]|nr:hypothetical protein [Mycobacteriales bacterium]